MTTARQDDEFKNRVIGNSLLEDSIEWIQRNMEPEDVFSDGQLEMWAKNKGYIEEE